MMADIFRMPRHNTGAGCCWRCCVTPATVHEFDSNAPWRHASQRLSHDMFYARVIGMGKSMSPLFGAPGVTSEIFLFDWLHAVDQGVCADFLGNILMMFLEKEEGRSKEVKCQKLFLRIKEYYTAHQIESRLPTLKLTMMMKKAGSKPKLRAKASEARCLVLFALLRSNEIFSDANPIEFAAKRAAQHLNSCYECLSKDAYSLNVLQREATSFLMLYRALNDSSAAQFWAIKPKFHIFAEMTSMDANPSTYWTYRDEDFGGHLANIARRRGGAYTPTAVAKSVLNKFRCKELPILRE
jgi:hypothetical protein